MADETYGFPPALMAELLAFYALILLFVDDWHHGVVALIAVAATSEACRG